MRRLPILIASVVLLAACSTVLKGETQRITIVTPGVKDTRCTLMNQYFRYTINPPHTFAIERTSQPYVMTCRAPGNRFQKITIPEGYENTAIWNITNGVLPGAAIDASSGALFRYPDYITVDFTNMKPEPMPPPSYQEILNENPLIAGMEEFRPGNSALQRDESSVDVPMQMKAPGSDEDSFGALDISSDKGANNFSGSTGTSGTSSTRTDTSSSSASARPATPQPLSAGTPAPISIPAQMTPGVAPAPGSSSTGSTTPGDVFGGSGSPSFAQPFSASGSSGDSGFAGGTSSPGVTPPPIH